MEIPGKAFCQIDNDNDDFDRKKTQDSTLAKIQELKLIESRLFSGYCLFGDCFSIPVFIYI